MDKIKKYQKIVNEIILDVAQKLSSTKDIQAESLVSIDKARGQYLILSDGWEGIERTYGPLVHIEIKTDGKVWLRYDGTDLEIGQELLNEGISEKDLVLAFYSPQMRKYTKFAVA
jgi:XisI protein